MQADREREASEREAALELQRLDAIERDEKGLWRRVDKLIAGKTVKAYDEAVGVLKRSARPGAPQATVGGVCAPGRGDSGEIFAAQRPAMAD